MFNRMPLRFRGGNVQGHPGLIRKAEAPRHHTNDGQGGPAQDIRSPAEALLPESARHHDADTGIFFDDGRCAAQPGKRLGVAVDDLQPLIVAGTAEDHDARYVLSLGSTAPRFLKPNNRSDSGHGSGEQDMIRDAEHVVVAPMARAATTTAMEPGSRLSTLRPSSCSMSVTISRNGIGQALAGWPNHGGATVLGVGSCSGPGPASARNSSPG